MKKIFLLSLFVHTFSFSCGAECFVEEILCADGVVRAQEGFLQEILHNNSALHAWYAQADYDQKLKLQDWVARLVNASITVIRESDNEFMSLLEEFDAITGLTNVKLVTEIDVTLRPAYDESEMLDVTKSHRQQPPELTQEIIEQMSPVKAWYESATDGEKKQFDSLLAQLFSYINTIAANADERKMRDLAGAIRILTGLQDLQFTLSVQMSIDQNPAVA